MEAAAQLLNAVFVEKQGNLTEAAAGPDVEDAITAWDGGRKEIVRLNGVIEGHVAKIKALKESVDETKLPRLERELKTLRAAKRRYEEDARAVIEKLEGHEAEKDRIGEEKAKEKETTERARSRDHGNAQQDH